MVLTWIGEILRKEPEARTVVIGATVTLVCKSSLPPHSRLSISSPLTIWLQQTSVMQQPPCAFGAWPTVLDILLDFHFPLSAAFSIGSILAMLALRCYITKYPQVLDEGFGLGNPEPSKDTEGIQGIPQRSNASDLSV